MQNAILHHNLHGVIAGKEAATLIREIEALRLRVRGLQAGYEAAEETLGPVEAENFRLRAALENLHDRELGPFADGIIRVALGIES